MRQHQIDRYLLLAVVGLMLLGSVVIFAIGPRVAIFENSVSAEATFSDNFYIKRHAFSVFMSLVAIFVGTKIPLKIYKKYSNLFLLFSFFLCLVVIFGGMLGLPFVVCDEGACRALRIGISLQPAELVKLGVLFYVSGLLKNRKERGLLGASDFWLPITTLSGIVGLLIGCGLKDFGSTVVIVTMIFSMMFVAGMPYKYILRAIGACALAAVVLILSSRHRIDRLMNFFSEDGDTYHKDNALIAIGTGGFYGLGLGNSIQSTGYLPETLSDSIFAVICEVFGFLGGLGVMFAYCFISCRILKISNTSRDVDNSLIAVGVFAWLISHVIINTIGMTGLFAMKGITLPFLSFGGSSMLFISLAIGLVLQISSWTKRGTANENSSSWRGQRGARNAGYRGRS